MNYKYDGMQSRPGLVFGCLLLSRLALRMSQGETGGGGGGQAGRPAGPEHIPFPQQEQRELGQGHPLPSVSPSQTIQLSRHATWSQL